MLAVLSLVARLAHVTGKLAGMLKAAVAAVAAAVAGGSRSISQPATVAAGNCGACGAHRAAVELKAVAHWPRAMDRGGTCTHSGTCTRNTTRS